MMKKISKKLLIFVMIALMAFIAACSGTPVDDGEDDDFEGITIYMSCYSGGFGSNFIRIAAERFNQLHANDGYRVRILADNKDNMPTITSKIQAKTTNADVFLVSDLGLDPLISRDLLMDVTDLYDRESDGVKLSEKIVDLDEWDYALKRNGKYYGIPHNDGLISAVMDYGLFEKMDWLVRDGNGNISAGKDGVPGTYDDGQPANLEEWNEMVTTIMADTRVPFIYSGKYYFYTNFFSLNTWAQYTGYENFKLNYTFNGDFYSVDTGNTTPISNANGFLMYQIDPGRRKATEFMYNNLANRLYIHPQCLLSSSHTEAQSFFILGHRKTETNPESAILFDGIWWQNEARAVFDACEEAKDYDYAYGVHDYRLMLAPNIEGSYGIDGEGNGSVIACNENSVIFAVAQENEAKERAIKEWLLFCTSDEVSRLYTTEAGGVRPYLYELTDEQYNSLNPFVKSVWDAYTDRENVKVLRSPLLRFANPLNYKTVTQVADPIKHRIGGIVYENILESMMSQKTVNDIMDGFTSYYSQDNWNKMLNELANLS